MEGILLKYHTRSLRREERLNKMGINDTTVNRVRTFAKFHCEFKRNLERGRIHEAIMGIMLRLMIQEQQQQELAHGRIVSDRRDNSGDRNHESNSTSISDGNSNNKNVGDTYTSIDSGGDGEKMPDKVYSDGDSVMSDSEFDHDFDIDLNDDNDEDSNENVIGDTTWNGGDGNDGYSNADGDNSDEMHADPYNSRVKGRKKRRGKLLSGRGNFGNNVHDDRNDGDREDDDTEEDTRDDAKGDDDDTPTPNPTSFLSFLNHFAHISSDSSLPSAPSSNSIEARRHKQCEEEREKPVDDTKQTVLSPPLQLQSSSSPQGVRLTNQHDICRSICIHAYMCFYPNLFIIHSVNMFARN